ncbi:MAG: efflux RND transporter periplasmic adaptor subunit [Candidatus Rokuibacteriota bacterium]
MKRIPGLALLLLAAMYPGCSDNTAESKQPPRRPAVPVAVAKVEQKTMPLQIQAIGTVEAYAVVAVRAQVGGELSRVHVKEGQDVKKGELLFTIDPRSLEATLAQAQATLAKDQVAVQQARANLARDQAQSRNAEVQAQRYADLFKRELVAQADYDQFKTNAEALAATVQADEAAVRSAEQLVRADEATVESAKVQLGYTTIRSPLDGRAGSLMLNQGNIVRATGTNDSTLLTINQIRPIYVSFTVPQQQLPAVKRYMAAEKLEVKAVPAGDPRPAKGVVTFVDNTVDVTTGTIRLKATFVNDEGRLWPGQFANVTLILATEPDAIVVPAQAVQSGQQGAFYVFVVKPDSTVDLRPVVVARTQGSETVIAKGLEKGEAVVTDGQPRLTAGAKVEVRGGERQGGQRPGGAPAAGEPRSAGQPGAERPAAPAVKR